MGKWRVVNTVAIANAYCLIVSSDTGFYAQGHGKAPKTEYFIIWSQRQRKTAKAKTINIK